ncbi:MAG: class I SAM-dependent methyltransferase [Armatimonadota bacterium]
MSDNPQSEIRRRLSETGRLTFAEVMEIALYHPAGGYYTSHVTLGPEGDFVTSPEEHPAFGALLARQAAQCWQALGAPAEFTACEMGGGRGTLAAAFLAHAREALPDFAAALRYRLIDRSPRLLAQQRERLAPFGDQVAWLPELPASREGLILSNELVDAFPVHRVIQRAEGLRELYVVEDDGKFAWEEGELSTPELAKYFARLGIELADGQRAEVNLAAPRWMRDVAGALARGFVITIDFGHLAKELYRPDRQGGTLLAYRGQRVSDDVLADLGLQDLIAHVDFTTLVDTGKEVGLEPLGLVTQHHFLLDLGLEGWLAALDTLPLNLSQRAHNRRALLALVETEHDGLGDAKVLVQAKGVTAQLDGLLTSARRPNAQKLFTVPMPEL